MRTTSFKSGDIVRSVYGPIFMINKITRIEGFQGSVSFKAELLSVEDGKSTDYLDTSELELVKESLSEKHKKDMSIREYYAGQALNGILSNPNSSNMKSDSIAKFSVELAHALVKELLL